MIIINFDFKRDDWIAFNLYHITHSEVHQRNRKRAIRAIPLMLIGLVLVQGILQDEWIVPAIVAIVAGGFWLWWYPSYRDKRVYQGIVSYVDQPSNQDYFGRHQVQLSEDSISLETSNTEKKINWIDVLKAEFNDDYYFVYDTPQTAIIIPRESIKDEPEFLSFLESKLNVL